MSKGISIFPEDSVLFKKVTLLGIQVCLLEANNTGLMFIKEFIYIIQVFYETPTVPLNYVFDSYYGLKIIKM